MVIEKKEEISLEEKMSAFSPQKTFTNMCKVEPMFPTYPHQKEQKAAAHVPAKCK
jgi:hypothetical protein